MFASGFASLAALFLVGGTGGEPLRGGAPATASETGSRVSTVAPVQEEAPGTPWTWRVAPYLFAANVDGTVSVGNVEVDTDVSFGDLVEKLDFGAMLMFEGHRGQFGFLVDSAYMDLGEDGKGSAGVAREADLRLGVVGVEALYRLTPTSPYEAVLGLRYLGLDEEVTVGPASADGHSDVFDAIAGARACWPFAERWRFGLYGDVGAGDSDLTWQSVANLGYDLDHWGINLGYRVLAYDVEDGSKELDIAFEGWMLGIEFRF